MSDYLFTFYGDDLTGSTDVMEILQWSGVPSVLFLEPPDGDTLRQRFPDAKAVGVAGMSRTMSPTQMDDSLPPAFEALRALQAPFFHYKVCSTFDSSPIVGNIGRATEIGMQIFGVDCVPMMVGAPALRRYVAFSNLFARVDDETYRLDRHPTMKQHPITPMNESDLRLHLGKQTDLRIASMTVLQMEKSATEVDAYYKQLRDSGAQVILFDSINDGHLHTIGRIIWDLKGETQVFLVGSSGFQFALAHYWHSEGIYDKPPLTESPGAVDQLVVMNGSAAPATAEQIAWATQHGYEGIQLDSPALIDPETSDAVRASAVAAALSALGSGKSVVLYSVKGPDDPIIANTKARMERIGQSDAHIGSLLGPQQGQILRHILEAAELTRAMVCGGDTCSYSARQLGIFALQAIVPFAPGAPLCRATSDDSRFDGLEVNLKAGQIGSPDFFDTVRQGK